MNANEKLMLSLLTEAAEKSGAESDSDPEHEIITPLASVRVDYRVKSWIPSRRWY